MNWKSTSRAVSIRALVLLLLLGGPLSCIISRSASPVHDPTRRTINIIDLAIEMYYRMHKKYPDKDLVQCLTGYRDDDGNPGYGYRLEPRGTVCGPWNRTHLLKTKGDPPQFVDSYGREIEYYLFDDMPDEVKDYINASPPGQAPSYYRRDYILRSRGKNGKWDKPRNPKSDDITNMR